MYLKSKGFRGFYAKDINRITTDGDIDLQTKGTFKKKLFFYKLLKIRSKKFFFFGQVLIHVFTYLPNSICKKSFSLEERPYTYNMDTCACVKPNNISFTPEPLRCQ